MNTGINKKRIKDFISSPIIIVAVLFIGTVVVGRFLFVPDETHTVKNSGQVAGAQTGTWTQTDWSGGANPGTVITDDQTTYDSAINVDTSVIGEISLQKAVNWAEDLEDWGKRAEITITNSDVELTDYQIHLDIDTQALVTAGKLQSNCQDIRLTDDAGNLLPYWVETGKHACNTTTTYIWTKLATLPVGDTSVYLYYQNSLATADEDGTAIFEFFDDFEDNSIDNTKWTQGVLSATSGTNFTESSGRLNGGNTNRYIQSYTSFTGNYIAESRVYEQTSANNGFSSVGFWKSTSDSFGILIHNGTTYLRNNGSWPNFGSFSKQKWSRDKVSVIGTAGYAERVAEDGSEQRTTSQTNTGGISGEYVRLSTRYDSSGTNQDYVGYWDWIFARKGVTTEPTVGSVGSEESKYSGNGTLYSNVYDTGFPSDWQNLNYTITGSGSYELKVRTDSNSDMSSAPAWSSCSTIASGVDISSNSCVDDQERYIQYMIQFIPSGAQAKTLTMMSIDYSASDQVAPIVNATDLTNPNDGVWTNDEETISWTAGQDDPSGNGLLGYCISLDEYTVASGSSSLLDPEITAGKLSGLNDGVSATYCPFIATGNSINLSTIVGLTLISGKEYSFSIKAVDVAGNIWSGASEEFQDLTTFKYDNTPPDDPAYISLPGNFVSTKNVTFTWPTSGPDAPSDANSGFLGIQYKIGTSGTWFGDLHLGTEDTNDLLANDGSYTMDETYDYPALSEGSNQIFIRTYDIAGNASIPVAPMAVLKVNTIAPSTVINLTVSPSNNTQNAYAFSWSPPTTYTGSINNIVYCYSVNSLPGEGSCSYTNAGQTTLTADAYASRPGENILYIVAKDEAGNINYDTYASVTFNYSGTAPGFPINVDIADISVKSTEDWRTVVTWNKPVNVGAGVSSYNVYRSTQSAACSINPDKFTKVGSTSGTSYVDNDLEQIRYYYCVKACDSANNCSAHSATVNELPTGKFTTPAELIKEPEVSLTTTTRAVISWVTERESDTKIAYGKTTEEYFEEELYKPSQEVYHTAILNSLDPDTTYFFRAKWTDEDGNTGISDEITFKTDPPPIIRNIEDLNTNVSSTTIRFTSVDASAVNLYYGLTDSFGGLEEISTSTAESTYTVPLVNLQDDIVYSYKINSIDIEGNEYEGPILTFKTLARPRVSNVQIQEVKETAQPTVEVIWETNTETRSILSYSPNNEPEQTNSKAENTFTAGEHKAEITGLFANTTYTMIITATDKIGNSTKSDNIVFTTATDSRPPAIENQKVESTVIEATNVNDNPTAQLIVSWDTDEPASGRVEVGEGTGQSYTISVEEEGNTGNDNTNHVVTVPNLDPSKVYHLRSVSTDSAGNTAYSGDVVTLTPKATDSVFKILFGTLSNVFGFF